MPAVQTATKNKSGKKIACGRCGKEIKPGEKYFHWKFRYGGKHTNCKDHAPRQSELTQSKMSAVYSAIESVEDVIVEGRWGRASVEDIRQAVEEAMEEINSVAQEYQDGLDNMPDSLQQSSTGEEINEKIEALQEFTNTLENATADMEDDQENEDALDDACNAAENALGEFTL